MRPISICADWVTWLMSRKTRDKRPTKTWAKATRKTSPQCLAKRRKLSRASCRRWLTTKLRTWVIRIKISTSWGKSARRWEALQQPWRTANHLAHRYSGTIKRWQHLHKSSKRLLRSVKIKKVREKSRVRLAAQQCTFQNSVVTYVRGIKWQAGVYMLTHHHSLVCTLKVPKQVIKRRESAKNTGLITSFFRIVRLPV